MTQKQASGQEQRLTFRVTVRPNLGLQASVVIGGRKLSAVVGDLSAEGLFVTLEHGALPALKIDTWVDVEVSFDGEKTLLFGVVRSQHAGGYGVHFPERDPVGRANPVARFARVSAHLQRSSLSQRLKVLKLRE
jgi:hypothetical protein